MCFLPSIHKWVNTYTFFPSLVKSQLNKCTRCFNFNRKKNDFDLFTVIAQT